MTDNFTPIKTESKPQDPIQDNEMKQDLYNRLGPSSPDNFQNKWGARKKNSSNRQRILSMQPQAENHKYSAIKLKKNFYIDRKIVKRRASMAQTNDVRSDTRKSRFKLERVRKTINKRMRADSYYSDPESHKSENTIYNKAMSEGNNSENDAESDGFQTFTLNDAFKQIGGFGRFQWLALILLFMVRNYGMQQVAGFVILTAKQSFICTYQQLGDQKEATEPPQICSAEQICELKKLTPEFFQSILVEVDKNDQNYYNNWYLQHDMMCMPQGDVSLFASCYFFGFAAGISLFMLPDLFGRKTTMKILMPIFIIASYLSIFGSTLTLKGFGLFIQGFLHVKVMLAYTHIFELTSEKNKAFCATVFNCLDVMTYTFQGFIYIYLSKDVVGYMQTAYIIQTTCVVMYLLVIPESPRWLFINNRHEEAINVLNFIARFNGSNKFIPMDAEFDFLEQAIVQQQEVKNAVIGNLKVIETSSIYTMANQFLEEDSIGKGSKFNLTQHSSLLSTSIRMKNEKPDSGVKDYIYTLFFDKAICGTFYRCIIMQAISYSLFYLTVFSVSQGPGSYSVSFVALGVGCSFGAYFSGFLIKCSPDYLVHIFGLLIVFANKFLLLFPAFQDDVFTYYVCMIINAFGIGILLNVHMIILSNRMMPHLIAISFELCFCISQLVASMTPALAKLETPLPNVIFCTLSIIGIVVVHQFRIKSGDTSQIEIFVDDLSDIASSVISSMLSDGEETVNNEQMKEHKQNQKQRVTNVLAQNWFSNQPGGFKDALSAGWNSSQQSDCDTNYEVSENE